MLIGVGRLNSVRTVISAPVGPLDIAASNSASPAFATSLRALSRSYALNGGPLALLRRSTDQATHTLYSMRNGQFSTSDLMSFAGTASVSISKGYDQTGNGRDAVQTTAASQPQLVTSGTLSMFNGVPVAQGAGVSLVTPALALAQPFLLSAINVANYGSCGYAFIFGNDSVPLNLMYDYNNLTLRVKVPGSETGAGNAAALNSVNGNSALITGTGFRARAAGVVQTTALSYTLPASTTFNIGLNCGGTALGPGFCEAMFVGNATAAVQDAIAADQAAFYGIAA